MNMNNDPELDGKYLGTISRDFVVVSETLKDASYQIRKRGFSEYPIFAVSKNELPVGELLLAKQDVDLEWNYYASFLDEFNQRNLVDESKNDDFIKVYKDPDEFCCLFIVDGDFTKFLFIPYPVD